MQALKYSAAVLAALAVGAVAHGQSVSKAGKGRTEGRTEVVLAVPPLSAPRPASGVMSAFPEDPDSPEFKQRQAAFAPSDEYRRQARAMYQSGDLAGAEKACLSALEMAPVIQGQRQSVPFIPHLLGQVYLKGGQYEKAVYWLRGAQLNEVAVGPGMDLDVALAYVRLGDYNHARQFYTDKATLQCSEDWNAKDLPGTDTPQSLEASILLAHGLDVFYEHRYDDALPDLKRAHRLAPGSALIAYYCAKILADKGRYVDAGRLYGRAAATGHGIIHDDALRRCDKGDKSIREALARPVSEPLF